MIYLQEKNIKKSAILGKEGYEDNDENHFTYKVKN